jgi:predicted ATPase
MGISKIKIKNFKSIKELTIELSSINILIGANGVGKSNFISFFKFLNKLYDEKLQLYINLNGRADNFLYFGSKTSDHLLGEIIFDNDWQNGYSFTMVPDASGSLIFENEHSNYTNPEEIEENRMVISQGGHMESVLKNALGLKNKYLREHFDSFRIYHFHDTSFNSNVKKVCNIKDCVILHEDGGNIAAVLYKLQETHPKHFKIIEKTIQSIAPFFSKFYLQPDEINPQQIFLRWYETGSEQMFTAHNFSDGTLRMICLTTLLLQPILPDTIIIDEPELGLHPLAISKLAGIMYKAATKTQLIISTQSVNLVNEFSADDIIVANRKNNQTVFKRQSEEALKAWLEEYSLGELWEKNIIGGRL